MQKPKIDQQAPSLVATMTVSMGCFWKPDALFGVMPEVVRTRVGYAGGRSPQPTYHDLSNHIETVEVDYDPNKIDFADLLDIFWYQHSPTTEAPKRQYQSAIFFHNDMQLEIANMTKSFQETRVTTTIHTEILPFKRFHCAEDYHQKYHLRQYAELLTDLLRCLPTAEDIMNSTAAARINGYISGYGKAADLENEITEYGLSEKNRLWLLQKVSP